MSTSIRTRLLLWMVGGMSLLLALFALAVYGTLVRSLVASFDAVLLSTARAVCSNVEREGDTIRVEIDEKQMPEFHRADLGFAPPLGNDIPVQQKINPLPFL